MTINTEAIGILSELEQIMAKPYYTLFLRTTSGKNKTRSMFAVDAADASRWVLPWETIVGMASQSDDQYTITGGFRDV